MSPEKAGLRDTIVFEAFERYEDDREAREALARERCGTDGELLAEVLADLDAEEEIRRRQFLLDIAGSARAATIPKGTVVGEYVIGRLIGSGGMGAVYEAQQPRLQRVVAVKFLQTRLADSATERFLSEARALSAIQSERVVHVYTYDEYQGQPYIVMEYVRGTNLADAIREGRYGELRTRLDIARQIAAALDDIHRAGIAHRDVKPSNVLIQPSGKIKLLDFGIAWRQDSQLTQVGQVMGTPAYMAPEQILRGIGGEVSKKDDRYKRVDVYSFGILLYELLTGRLPFTGDTRGEVEHNILHQTLPLDPLWESTVPAEVVDLISRATSRQPNMRPDSCGEIERLLNDAITSLSQGGAVLSGRSHSRFRARRKRLGWAAAALAASMVLLFASLWKPTVGPLAQPGPVVSAAPDGGRSRVSLPPAIEQTAQTPATLPSKISPQQPKPAGEGTPSPAVSKPVSEPPVSELPDAPMLVAAEKSSIGATIETLQLPRAAALPPAPAEAPEQQHWARIRDSGDIAALRSFWESYPTTSVGREARDKAARIEWESVHTSTDVTHLRRFAGQYAGSDYARQALNLAMQWEARAAAKKQVLQTLRQYAEAYSNRDLARVATFRALTQDHYKRIATTFSESRKVQLTINPAQPEFPEPVLPDAAGPDFSPKTATVKAGFQLRLIGNAGDTAPLIQRNFTYTLKRTGETWKITDEQ